MIRKESKTPITGLQEIIENTRKIMDYREIAKFFNITYDGAYKKVLQNRFSAEEAISLFLAFSQIKKKILIFSLSYLHINKNDLYHFIN